MLQPFYLKSIRSFQQFRYGNNYSNLEAMTNNIINNEKKKKLFQFLYRRQYISLIFNLHLFISHSH